MVKQPAWAAAISSSGFVPTPSSKRDLNEYCVSFNVVVSVLSFPAPSLSEPSTGIGLYLCRKIVQKYNGDFLLDSEGVNQGARFSVLFKNEKWFCWLVLNFS